MCPCSSANGLTPKELTKEELFHLKKWEGRLIKEEYEHSVFIDFRILTTPVHTCILVLKIEG